MGAARPPWISASDSLNRWTAFACAVVIAAILSRQADAATELRSLLMDWALGLTDRSVLIGGWVVVYALLLRLIVSNKSHRLQEWIKDVHDTTNTAMTRVTSSDAVSRIRSSVAASSCARLLNLTGCSQQDDRTMVISATEPFLPLDQVARLSLLDMKDLFYYAKHVNNGSAFAREKFLKNLRLSARLAAHALDEATASSRGSAALPTSQTDIDALYYAAVLRLFAEWRTVRLVPTGSNQRYSFGMGLARRDLVQNISKIEDAAHQWLLFNEGFMHQSNSTAEKAYRHAESPTLRQLLDHEIRERLHRNLPRLADQSAASGLLWSKRQLCYQTTVFENTLQIPSVYPTSKAAVNAAYKSTYDAYHGFIVKQLFQGSFEAAPAANEIFAFMSALSSVEEDAQTDDMSASDDENDSEGWIQLPVDATYDDGSVRLIQPPDEHPMEQIATHVATFFGQCVGLQGRSRPSRNIMGATPTPPTSLVGDASIKFDISKYLEVVKPLLAEIDDLIAQLNMNDPTKV
jgi:hypothetical protein